MRKDEHILTINGGSSSIKFSLYKIELPLQEIFTGQVENIGTVNAKLSYHYSGSGQINSSAFEASSHDVAASNLIDWLEKQEEFDSIKVVGHRIVHGMHHTGPQIISAGLLKELKTFSAYDPEHLPEEIKLVEIFSKHYPAMQQVACFDTSFHTTMPTVAKMLSIPRKYFNKGIRRYGFHGLSYAFLMQELEKLDGKQAHKEKLCWRI